MNFIKLKEKMTNKPKLYLPFYSPGWKDWTWYYDLDFKKNYDYLERKLVDKIWNNKEIDKKGAPFVFAAISPDTPEYYKRFLQILSYQRIQDWKEKLKYFC
jgi:hypothetical protein